MFMKIFISFTPILTLILFFFFDNFGEPLFVTKKFLLDAIRQYTVLEFQFRSVNYAVAAEIRKKFERNKRF